MSRQHEQQASLWGLSCQSTIPTPFRLPWLCCMSLNAAQCPSEEAELHTLCCDYIIPNLAMLMYSFNIITLANCAAYEKWSALYFIQNPRNLTSTDFIATSTLIFSEGGIKQCQQGLRHSAEWRYLTCLPQLKSFHWPSKSPRTEMFPRALVEIFFAMSIN